MADFGWGDFFSGLGSVVKTVAPIAVPLASQWYQGKQQADMMKDLNKAQQQSYSQYLGMMKPSAAERGASYNQEAANIRSNAELGARRLGNTMAARGIRGQGTIAPVANYQGSVMDAENQLYNNIYGIENRYPYGTPGAPPVDYAPSSGQLGGSNIASYASYMSPQLFG